MIESPTSDHVEEKPDHVKQKEEKIYDACSAIEKYRSRKSKKEKVAEKARVRLIKSR
jgi:predicted GNAT family acetyltransferase